MQHKSKKNNQDCEIKLYLFCRFANPTLFIQTSHRRVIRRMINSTGLSPAGLATLTKP
jgi:hypothetical protein